jgi:outer membrane lipoprotein
MRTSFRKYFAVLFLIAVLPMLFACAPVFSPELLNRVDRSLPFSELRKAPDQHKGALVLFGGMIVSVKNSQQGSIVEILQKPLDSDNAPLDTDLTEGRFLAHTDQYLDPAVFLPGRMITVIGEVAGSKMMLIDEVQYQYPLLNATAMHLWKPSAGPRFFFSFGVSGRM